MNKEFGNLTIWKFGNDSGQATSTKVVTFSNFQIDLSCCMQNDSIFEISINDHGRSQILRLFGRIKILFIASLILTFTGIVETFLRMSFFSETFRQTTNRYRFQFIASYTYSFIILFCSYCRFGFTINSQNRLKKVLANIIRRNSTRVLPH